WEELQKLPLVYLVEKLIGIYNFTTVDNPHLPYLLTFKDKIDGFTAGGERGIIQFLEFWEEDGSKAVLPSNGKINAVEVTTIHKSKGLAYDVVMVPFCSWKIDGMINGDFWIHTEQTPFAQLGKIPVKYNSHLANSIFYKQYYEELLFNYMDALNTLYVATTRAVRHLYISAPAFKKNIDKKSGTVIGMEIKNEYIGDPLYQVLDREDSPFPLADGSLAIHAVQPSLHPPQNQTSDKHIALHNYPISGVLEQALSKSGKRHINTILMMEKASQYGILAHEVMAEARSEADIGQIINRYIEEGILAEENRGMLLNEIQQIWHHPIINRWLTGTYKVWNEAAIITAEGKTIRPDKVFTSESETIVLDFKFTNDDYVAHKTQVDQYRNTLRNLGYQRVKGYLYYAKSNQLVEVNEE